MIKKKFIEIVVNSLIKEAEKNGKRVRFFSSFLTACIPGFGASAYTKDSIEPTDIIRRLETLVVQMTYAAQFRVLTFKLCLLAVRNKKINIVKLQTPTQSCSAPIEGAKNKLRRSSGSVVNTDKKADSKKKKGDVEGEKVNDAKGYEEAHIACIPDFERTPTPTDPTQKANEDLKRVLDDSADIDTLLKWNPKSKDVKPGAFKTLVQFSIDLVDQGGNTRIRKGIKVTKLAQLLTTENLHERENKDKKNELEKKVASISKQKLRSGIFGDIKDIAKFYKTYRAELVFSKGSWEEKIEMCKIILLCKWVNQIHKWDDINKEWRRRIEAKKDFTDKRSEWLSKLLVDNFTPPNLEPSDNEGSTDYEGEDTTIVAFNSILGLLLGQTMAMPGEINHGIDTVYDATHSKTVPDLLSKFSATEGTKEDFDQAVNEYITEMGKRLNDWAGNSQVETRHLDDVINDLKKSDNKKTTTVSSFIDSYKASIAQHYINNTNTEIGDFEKLLFGTQVDNNFEIKPLLEPAVEFELCKKC